MAEQEDIDQVKINIPDDFDQYGWQESTIETLLDSGLSVAKVTLSFYKGMVSKVATMVDVTENSSSRSLGSIYRNAKDLLDYWQKQVDQEDNPEPQGHKFPVCRKAERV